MKMFSKQHKWRTTTATFPVCIGDQRIAVLGDVVEVIEILDRAD